MVANGLSDLRKTAAFLVRVETFSLSLEKNKSDSACFYHSIVRDSTSSAQSNFIAVVFP